MRSPNQPSMLNLALILVLANAVTSQLSFIRDAVERPPAMVPAAVYRAHLHSDFGSRSLPLREAVEQVPPQVASFRSTTRLPLRDAVESSLAPQSLQEYVENWWWRRPQPLQQDFKGTKGSEQYKVVCYVEGWAVYRREPVRFSTHHIDPFACTHVIYAFATLDPHGLHIIPQDDEYDIVKGGYRSLVGLKRANPSLKVLISVGGYTEARRKFAEMTATASNRREFIRSVLHFLDQHEFDGIDLDWEFPGAEDLGGHRGERQQLTLLVEELAEVFAPRGWLLTISASPSRFRIEDGYDVPRLAKHLDFINLMAFDMHAERDSAADHHAPLGLRKHDKGLNVFFNVDYAVRYWLKKGAPREKIVLGVPFYGRSFTLTDSSKSTPGSPVKSYGAEGPYTQQQGFLAYFEILQLQDEGKWKLYEDDAHSPYMVKGDQWVGYDTPQSLAEKMLYIKRNQLGGAMVWALDLDDFKGLYGEKWPLLSTVRNSLMAHAESPASIHKPQPVLVDSTRTNCTGHGYIRDPMDCRRYHQCEWGMRHTYLCPQGLYYDTKLQHCNWAQLVDCTLAETGASVPSVCSTDGVMPDPEDCTKYYWCTTGKPPMRYPCGIGQYFDGRTNLCSYGSSDSCNITSQHPHNTAVNGRQLIGEDNFKVVCYFTNWAWYREAGAKFAPEHVDTRLCSHVVYAYAMLDPDELVPKSFDPRLDLENNFYQRLTSLPGPRQRGSEFNVLLGLGGWTDSTGDKYSRLVSDGTARRNFVVKTVAFLRQHKFKGLHLDWNYPRCWQSNCAKGPTSDKPNFTKLIQELSQEFKRHDPPLILAIALSGYREVIDEAYDLGQIGKHVEFLSVMTYDYHGSWERKVGHGSPLYYRYGDAYPQYNTNYTLEYLVSRGAPRNKLLLGIPFYGQSFRLASQTQSDIGSAAAGPGEAGEFTHQPGMLAYFEICDRVRNHRWHVSKDRYGATGPYAYHGDQWVGFEDVTSVKEKAKFVRNMGYGGAMAWTMDLDDFQNRCCQEPFPLLRSINRVFGRLPEHEPVTGDCSSPPEPITPPPPPITTTDDSGSSPTYPPSTWPRPTTRPSTTMGTTTPPTSATTTTTTTITTTKRPTYRPPSTTRPTYRPPSTTTQHTTTKRPSGTSPVQSKCEPGSYRPDPANCNAYYRCILGEFRKEYCAGGLHWNADRRICDWPNEAKCGQQQSTLMGEMSTSTMSPWSSTKPSMPPTTTSPAWWVTHPSTSRPTTPEWWTTTRSTTSKKPTTTTQMSATESHPATPPPPPMDQCVSGQYYPDHNNCKSFYVCVNGALIQQTCAPGLVWNHDATRCDWTFNVKCVDRKHAALQRVEVDSPCTEGPFTPYPGDCSRYLYCQWGHYKEGFCGSGLNWNNEAKICDWPTNAHCETSTTTSHPGPGPGDTSTTTAITMTSSVTTMKTTTIRTTTSTTPVPHPEGPELSGYFKVVCYFTNWAFYRPGVGKYVPENINTDLCTHIVYGFAVLDYENLILKAHDSWADFDNKFYERVVAMKKGRKVSLAIGGWNDSAGDKYSRLVNSKSARRRFIKNAIEFLEKYKFDGLDLDWEYPVCWQVDCNKGPKSDKAAFADLVKELRQAFEPKGLLLSAAVSPSKTVIDAGYDVPVLGQNLDWVAVMTYDYHGQWDKKTGHVAPMYFHTDDDFYFFNANFSINYWISQGVHPRKIVMGMPLYGQSFTLAQVSVNGLNAPAPGPGQAGEYTRAAGFLAYYEICDRIKSRGWTVVQDSQHRMGPYAFKGNQWVGFDDVAMIKRKSEYIRQMNLGGGMVWALDLDDFRNVCGQGSHPLLNTIRTVLAAPHGSGDHTTAKPVTTTKPSQGGSGMGSTTKPHHPKPSTTSMKPPPQLTTTKRPGVPGTMTDEFKVVCYFTNWAWYRQGMGKYLPGNIDPNLCTHIVYGFAVLDGDQLVIKPHDSWADIDNNFYEKVAAYKKYGIKVLLAIGGWNDSAGDKYSRLANSPSARARFIQVVMSFIEKYGFDGLDLDWEYPKCWQVDCNKGPDSDKDAFASFVKELHDAFHPKGYLLSSAVSPSRVVINAGYDVSTLSKYLDWIAVMAYDYHGQWDKITGHVAPMYTHPDDTDVTFNANFSINYWIQKGADRKKIVMGMPMYGQSFSLADNSNHGLNAPTYGGGEAGDYTRARGFLSYYEICDRVKNRNWNVVKDPLSRMGPYAYSRDQWVSFDDTAMIRLKSEYIRNMGLGGGMIWALDLDDFTDSCHCEPYPLLRTINRVLRGYPGPDPICDIPATESSKLEGMNDNHNTLVTVTQAVVPIGTQATPGSHACSANQMFVPDSMDCSKYYLCQHGQLLEQFCPPGLQWNKDHCDWPENAACNNKPMTTSPMPKPTSPVMTTSEMTTHPMPNTTSMPVQQDNGYKVVCYFTNWAWYRTGIGKYLPEDIDSSLCTHIIYGFSVLDGSTLTIKPHDSWADLDNEFFRRVTDFKKKGIKVLLAIGGWNDSLGDKYSRLVNSPSAREKFIKTILQFLMKYNFDGLDLDWEYPKCWQVDCNKGPDSDKDAFAALVTELHAAFKPHNLLLSSAVSPSKLVIDLGYDVPVLSRKLDWISVMTYDFHGHWDKKTGHVAPLYYYPGDTYDYFNANFSLHYWLQKGADPKKIIMGMPMYGQSFSLADSSVHGLNAKAYGPGQAGEFTRAGGFMAYYEVCYNVKNRGWTPVRDPEGRMGPYAYNGNQWVSYDDVEDIRRKSRFIKDLGLGGGMIWALDLDDFRNRCGCGTYPLLQTINSELRGRQFTSRDCT